MALQSQRLERLEAETETLDGSGHLVDIGLVSDRKNGGAVSAGVRLIALTILFYGVTLFGVVYVAGLIP
jgi:hypothetical protein